MNKKMWLDCVEVVLGVGICGIFCGFYICFMIFRLIVVLLVIGVVLFVGCVSGLCFV